MDEPIIQLAAILLIPLVPAFLLYRLLPTTADVTGPIGGLSVRFTGAFGGYVVLVLVAIGFFRTLPPRIDMAEMPFYVTYEVEGLFQVEGVSEELISPDNVEVVLRPTALTEYDGVNARRYSFDLPARWVNGEVRYPVNRLQFRVRNGDHVYVDVIDFRDVDLPSPRIADVIRGQPIPARGSYDVRLVVDPTQPNP